mgnify:CR=1 FL=1
MSFIENEYDPWVSPVVEDYLAEKNDRGYFDIDELNRFLRTEKIVMEKDYEEWIDDTYSAAGR